MSKARENTPRPFWETVGEACRARREAQETRRKLIAECVRVTAERIGAVRTMPSSWRHVCACGNVTSISDEGSVSVPHGMKCETTKEIETLLQDERRGRGCYDD